jgi:hypothetical protein
MTRYLMGPFLLAVLVLTTLGAAAPAQAATCGGCGVIQENCAASCVGLKGKDEVFTCLLACDNAAAACSCDEPVTLRSEGVVRQGLAGHGLDGFAFKAGACHSTAACGPAYGACASWSGYSDCGDPFCGIYKFCGDPPFCEEPDLCFGPALRTKRERFRVCFNASGQPCTEYQQIEVVLGCGC